MTLVGFTSRLDEQLAPRRATSRSRHRKTSALAFPSAARLGYLLARRLMTGRPHQDDPRRSDARRRWPETRPGRGGETPPRIEPVAADRTHPAVTTSAAATSRPTPRQERSPGTRLLVGWSRRPSRPLIISTPASPTSGTAIAASASLRSDTPRPRAISSCRPKELEDGLAMGSPVAGQPGPGAPGSFQREDHLAPTAWAYPRRAAYPCGLVSTSLLPRSRPSAAWTAARGVGRWGSTPTVTQAGTDPRCGRRPSSGMMDG